jgi:hypothetical protein
LPFKRVGRLAQQALQAVQVLPEAEPEPVVSPENLNEAERERCRTDPLYLGREYLGYTDLDDKVHGEMFRRLAQYVEECQSWSENLSLGEKIKGIVKKEARYPVPLVFEMPRGHLKTSAISVLWVIQRILKNPNVAIRILSYGWGRAVEILTEIKDHLTNPKLVALFPEILWETPKRQSPKWGEDAITVKRTKVVAGYTIKVDSIMGGITGSHCDEMYFDDLHDIENTATPEQIAKVILRFRNCRAVLKPKGLRVVIGTVWTKDDFLAWCEEQGFEIYRRVATYNSKGEECDCDDPDAQPFFPTLFEIEELRQIKRELGRAFYACNPGDAPILMANGTFKPLADVRVGDMVMGFRVGKPSGLVPTKVMETNSRVAATVLVRLENGDTLRCTPDHHWFHGGRAGRSAYLPPQIGRRLWHVVDTNHPPNRQQEREYAYLAGLLDGEGACKYGSLAISQSTEKNPEVCQAIASCLDGLGLSYTAQPDVKPRPGDGRARGAASFVLSGGRNTKFRIIQYARPAKSKQILDNLMRISSGFVAYERPRVIEIVPYKRERVFALTTGTGNYVAWGYASRNCQYNLKALADEDLKFTEDMIHYYKDEVPYSHIWLLVDPALGRKKTGDESVTCVVGKPRDLKLKLHVLKSKGQKGVKTQQFVTELIAEAVFYLKAGCDVTLGIESAAMQYVLHEWVEKELREKQVPITPVELKHGSRPKAERVSKLLPLFENEMIELHPTRCEKLVRELLDFGAIASDNHPDALAYLVDLLDYEVDVDVIDLRVRGGREDPERTFEEEIEALVGGEMTWKDY